MIKSFSKYTRTYKGLGMIPSLLKGTQKMSNIVFVELSLISKGRYFHLLFNRINNIIIGRSVNKQIHMKGVIIGYKY